LPTPDWEKRLARIDSAKHVETILDWLAKAKWPGSSSAAAWEAMFARLVEIGEPGAVVPLREMARELPEFLGAKHRAWMAERIEETAHAIAKKSKGKKKSAPLAVRKPGPTVDTMSIVQRVFDAPHDDDVRRVVADELLEHGDPWGEFIQLGFLLASGEASAEQKKRAETLAAKNAPTFAGPLAKIVKADSRGFEKGFLKRVLTNASMVGRLFWEAAATTPYWSTVTRLEIDMTTTPRWWTPALMKNPALRGLREVHFNYYYDPLLSFAQEGEAWKLTQRKTDAEPWLRFARTFAGTLPKPEADELLAAIG
jgi:uncharacterized protein (TIGR02996 family)